jgi:SMC interacting uncharacterized protein involved in chromosome segregation
MDKLELEKKIAEQEGIIKHLEGRCGWLQDEWENAESQIKSWQSYTSVDQVNAIRNENITLNHKIDKLNKNWTLKAYALEQRIDVLGQELEERNASCSCRPVAERKEPLSWNERYRSADQGHPE